MLLKVSTIIDAIKENEKDIIIYSDIDIQFLNLLKLLLKEMKLRHFNSKRLSIWGILCRIYGDKV